MKSDKKTSGMKSLQTRKRKHSNDWKDANEPVSKHPTDMLPPQFSPRHCILCKKTRKNKNGTKIPLIMVLTGSLIDGDRLYNCIKQNNDSEMIAFIRTHDRLGYHKNCFRSYTRKVRESSRKPFAIKIEKSIVSFSKLCENIEKDIIKDGKTRRLQDILNEYKNLLSDSNNAMPSFQSGRLKHKLINYFGDKLQFWQPTSMSKSEIVFSSQKQVGQLLDDRLEKKENPNLKNKIQKDKNEDDDEMRTLFHASNIIKRELETTSSVPWPPTREDIDGSNYELPLKVFNMLAWIVSSNTEFQRDVVPLSTRDRRLVLSLGQDLVYMLTKGRICPPKHISLSVAMKTITGSPEAVSILNRFGYTISYEKLKDVEATLAKREAMVIQNGSLPSTIHPNVFITFCYDNNDLQEETLSGKCTTHCTNGIAIQKGIDTCQAPSGTTNTDIKNMLNATEIVPVEILTFNTCQAKSPEYPNVVLPHPKTIDDCIQKASIEDFIWFLARFGKEDSDEPQCVPGWSGFNSMIYQQDVPKQSNISYLPVIDASPTKASTVYTMLVNTVAIGKKHGQNDHPIVVDQAIYAKAQQIVWQKPVQFKSIVLRLGDFHVCMTFLAVIEKRFEDAGLADILTESEIIAPGSIPTVISGKHYNRALRIHKIVFEALEQLRWDAFIETENSILSEYDPLMEIVKKLRHSITNENFYEVLECDQLKILKTKYEAFCEAENGPMKSFWSSYIEMVSLLLMFIRATRLGQWHLHLSCLRRMLPFMFAYDRLNYARYMTLYWAEMSVLGDNHPDANKEFENGNFVVQRSGNAFSQIPVDQTIEQTINKSSKTRGGIIGFSLKKNSVNKWVLSANARAAITDDLKAKAGLHSPAKSILKEEREGRLHVDESNVIQIMDTIKNFQNPFLPSVSLTQLASGIVADENTKNDLLCANVKGNVIFEEFLNERILSKKRDLTDKMTKLNLKTSFSSSAKKKMAVKGVSKNNTNLFGRLLIIAQIRKFQLSDLFTHELGVYPCSLATNNGGMQKTAKSKLARTLENLVPYMNEDADASACLFDAMSLFHSIQRTPDTFSALAKLVFDKIVGIAHAATRIDFVCDTYQLNSIKNAERAMRVSEKGKITLRVTNGSQKCPTQWKRYLMDSESKTSLTKFIAREWSKDSYKRNLGEKVLYVTSQDLCYKILPSSNEPELVPELISSQEEADTRLLLHAKHASDEGHASVIIHSQDTDVEVLAIYHQRSIAAEIYIQSGTIALPRLVCVKQICSSLGTRLIAALPGIHSISGCDTTSSFSGKGKHKVFQLARSNDACEIFGKLGEQLPIDETSLASIESSICALYGFKGSTNINSVRYLMFSRNPDMKLNHLPPTKDALILHIERANYQAYIWKNALDALIQLPNPILHGWKMVDGELSIEWTKKKAAPDAILELVVCGCKGTCDTARCTCHSNNLQCTDTCKCTSSKCTNRDIKVEEQDESDDEFVYEGVDSLGGIHFAIDDEDVF